MEEMISLLSKDVTYLGHEFREGCIYIKIESSRTEVECPLCGTSSFKRHSAYERIFGDLPIQGMKVILVLNNRKMFCNNSQCSRTTFAERFDFISDKSKKTKRLEEEIVRISLNMSTVAAAQLLSKSTVTIGRSTVSRLQKKSIN